MLSSKTLLLALALSVASAAHGQSTAPVNVPLPAEVAGAKLVGHLSPSTVLNMAISVAPRDRAGLEAMARAVSDPINPNYHRFMSPAAIGAQFGASDTTVNTVAAYLKSKGLNVSLIASNRMAILFSGKVSNVENAFSTKINRYHLDNRSTPGPLDFYSNATVAKVPTGFASQVVAIEGFDTANPPIRRTSQLRPQDARNIYDAAALYGGALGGHKGQGINIGISNFDGYRISNAAAFGQAFGLPTPNGGAYGSNVHKVIVTDAQGGGGVDGESVGEGYEGDLDFQMVLGIAPKSDIYIYDGIGGGLIRTLATEANDNLVDIISESYGFRAGNAFYIAAHDQHLAMSVQGITYMGASGDNGTTDLFADPYPDFDPDVLMVGGSDATLDASGNLASELGWDGSGSGWAVIDVPFNVLPAYQKGTGIPTNVNRRLVPDLALHATSWSIFYGGSLIGIGGTSASSPSFAGQLGLILQKLAENDGADVASNGRPRLGRIQDSIYKFNGDATVFRDLLGGDAGPLPSATNTGETESVGRPGWDFVTGLGAPIDGGLYTAFLSAASVSVTDGAKTADIYVATSPTIALGTLPQGDAAALLNSDSTSYTIQSIRQNGVGQVAAATIGVKLQTAKQRRSLSLLVALKSPKQTTETVFLLNTTTGKYDLVRTITGTATTNSVQTFLSLDTTGASPYVKSDGTMQILVRSLKPARFGSVPYRLEIDQAVAIERVAKN